MSWLPPVRLVREPRNPSVSNQKGNPWSRPLRLLITAAALLLPLAIRPQLAAAQPPTPTARGRHRIAIRSAPVTPDIPFLAPAPTPDSSDPSLTNNQIVFVTGGVSAGVDQGNRVEQIGVSGSSLVAASTIDLADGSQTGDSGINYSPAVSPSIRP